jgi:hypothetical protein
MRIASLDSDPDEPFGQSGEVLLINHTHVYMHVGRHLQRRNVALASSFPMPTIPTNYRCRPT